MKKISSTRGLANQLVIYPLVLICGSGALGLSAVSMRHQISVTANSTKAIEAQIADTERRIAETTATIEAESDTNVLLRRNELWNLGLSAPKQEQIVHISEDPARQLAAKRNRTLLAETGGSAVVAFPLAQQR